jgi:predicted metal-dependent phosphoesterase TrpH
VGIHKLKMELHSHTDFDPVDWIEHSAEQLIDEAARQGVGVLAITCHNALQWSPLLAQYAQNAGVLLIPAVEASIEGKDVLIYGLREFHSPMNFAQLRQLRRLEPEIFVIAPHPFYPGVTCLGAKVFEYADCFDGIEYCHFYTSHVDFNRKAVKAAHQLNKPLIGTSDIHLLSQMGKTTSSVRVQETSFAAVSAAIKRGEVQVCSTPLSWAQVGWYLFHLKIIGTKGLLARLGMLRRKNAAGAP